jgi:hypothetical protein
MKWSWKLANIGGINIYVHSTFLIIQAAIKRSRAQNANPPSGALETRPENECMERIEHEFRGRDRSHS